MLAVICFIFLALLQISQANTITSCANGNTCDCNDNEDCTVNCIGFQSCYGATINVNGASSITFSCNGAGACTEATINGPTTNIPFVITCTGACRLANITAGNASSFDLYCDGDNSVAASCSDANINCGSGTGICIIHCIAAGACHLADIDCGSASQCELLCDSGWDGTCSDLDSLNCRNSGCSMQCGTGYHACIANTPPITTNAISFICNGASCDTEYINALKGFTPYPTQPSKAPSNHPTNPSDAPTSDPTTNPSKYPTLTPTQPPSFHPTTNPSDAPTRPPSASPTHSTSDPTTDPTIEPTSDPTRNPTIEPTRPPSASPTHSTSDPTRDPTIDPTTNLSSAPRMNKLPYFLFFLLFYIVFVS